MKSFVNPSKKLSDVDNTLDHWEEDTWMVLFTVPYKYDYGHVRISNVEINIIRFWPFFGLQEVIHLHKKFWHHMGMWCVGVFLYLIITCVDVLVQSFINTRHFLCFLVCGMLRQYTLRSLTFTSISLRIIENGSLSLSSVTLSNVFP